MLPINFFMLVIDPSRAYENQVHHDSIYVDNIETSRGKFCNGMSRCSILTLIKRFHNSF